MPFLKSASITFYTHGDNKNANTIVHVFVKNRLGNSLTPEQDTDFISNWLAFQRYQPTGDLDGDRNPYLAHGVALAHDQGFDDPSTHEIPLPLVSDGISVDDVVVPEVDIHMLTDGYDRWIFDYTVNLSFDNGVLSFGSAVDGMQGIILDQDNRNHSAIGIENPLRTKPLPALTKAATNAILKKVTLEFDTHNDDKDADTRLNVHIVNRLSATSAQDIAIGLDLFRGQAFPDSGSRDDLYRTFSWSYEEGTLASNAIRLADIVLPVVYIVVVPNGDNRWIFDYRVTYEFEDPQEFEQKRHVYSSRTYGVILGQDNNKHAGVYQGRPFPTVAPPTAPKLTNRPVDHTGDRQKKISIPFLRRKLNEFVNNRNGPDTGPNPPLRKVRLDSSPPHGSSFPLPESYADVQAITAGGDGRVHYVSSPMSLGQIQALLKIGEAYTADIQSASMHIAIDATSPTPVTLTVTFAPGGTVWTPVSTVTPLEFSVSLKLTLDRATTINEFGVSRTVVDLMHWVTELEPQYMTKTFDHAEGPLNFYKYVGTFLYQPVDLVSIESVGDLFVDQVVNVVLIADSAFQDTVRTDIRDKIYDKLVTPDVITGTTLRDGINSMATSWLLGGVADDQQHTDDNNAVIHGIGVQTANPELGILEDTLVIDYTGPRNVFVPQAPADWPTPGHPSPAHDFSPGRLANIDHIVVLTMENRSFDHMLGYLSLPTSKHGMGRTDVDGLKGGESNSYNGSSFPSIELSETRFSPDPPHGYEAVHHAINGGKMDGFVKSYAEAHGDARAGRIMGYHTGANVPVYDALARDFAIGHRWFASHPGPTFCNRFYELTGRLNLDPRGFWEFDNSSPLRPVYTPTIFDYLSDAVDPGTGQPITWRYFEHGYCFLRFFEGHTFDDENIVTVDDPQLGFFASAQAGTLPNVSFIDPHFIEYPPNANCDGPPADVRDGQVFVQRVVEAVVASPAWNKTLLLIVYDEHGGFYDHVPPSPAAPVSRDLSIKTHGVRVPAFVISPWVGAATVFGYDGPLADTGGGMAHPGSAAMQSPGVASPVAGLHFDHTSILKTIARRFLSTNPPYMGARYAAANDLSAVIGTHLRQPQFRPFIRYRLQFARSGMMLDVRMADRAPGTILWQRPGDDSVEQDFSFEDAGGGFVYIRSHVSNLYVTAHVPDPVVVGGNMAPTATAGGTPAADPPVAGLIQDVKYSPGHVVLPGGARPELQRWKLSSASLTIFDPDLYVISNQAYPGMVLQPADPSQPQSPVVLGAPASTTGVGHGQNTWKVSNPLLAAQPVIAR